MRSSVIFREYVWLLGVIRDAGRISFKEIADRWERASINESGEPMSRTTFNRHRVAIEEIFDVEIRCDRAGGNMYFIEESAQVGSQEVIDWMCDSLATGTLISDFRSLSHRISLEPVPTAGSNLRLILEAMTRNVFLSMSYHRIGEESEVILVAPYAVKLFKQRWYMLGRVPEKHRLRLFSLERVDEVSATEERFVIPDDFSVQKYFSKIFGVMMPPEEVECERVVLRAFGRDQLYLEDLPMHPSQRVLERGDVYTDFELELKPSSDFAAAILSRGGWVKVLEPEWFANELLDRAEFMLESFETEFP